MTPKHKKTAPKHRKRHKPTFSSLRPAGKAMTPAQTQEVRDWEKGLKTAGKTTAVLEPVLHVTGPKRYRKNGTNKPTTGKNLTKRESHRIQAIRELGGYCQWCPEKSTQRIQARRIDGKRRSGNEPISELTLMCPNCGKIFVDSGYDTRALTKESTNRGPQAAESHTNSSVPRRVTTYVPGQELAVRRGNPAGHRLNHAAGRD